MIQHSLYRQNHVDSTCKITVFLSNTQIYHPNNPRPPHHHKKSPLVTQVPPARQAATASPAQAAIAATGSAWAAIAATGSAWAANAATGSAQEAIAATGSAWAASSSLPLRHISPRPYITT